MKEWSGLSHPPLKNPSPSEINSTYTKEGPSATQIKNSEYTTSDFHKKLDQSTLSELTIKNETKPLLDRQSFLEKIKIIKNAKKSIYVSSLVFINEPSVNKIADELIKKAKDQLDVRVILEGAYTPIHGKVARRLKAGGVLVVYANDFLKYNKMTIYHTKVIITDKKTVIMGGQNMVEADLASEGTDLNNRDLDISIKGPGVIDVLENFISDWNHFTGKDKLISRNKGAKPFSEKDLNQIQKEKETQRENGLRGSDHYTDWFKDSQNSPEGMGRFIGQSPYKNLNTITEGHLSYIEGLKDYFGISIPNVFDTKTTKDSYMAGVFKKTYTNFNRLFDSIQNKITSNPNLNMDLMTTSVDFAVNEAAPMTETRMTKLIEENKVFLANLNQLWLNRNNLKMYKDSYEFLVNDWLPHRNVNIWAHHSYLHSKIWFFDRIAVSIGSFNMHHNATDHSYEATFISQDPKLIKDIEGVMAEDQANSFPITQ